MPHLKLVKLMYLSERESLRLYGDVLTGDRFVSMPHGPVLSLTLNHIDDEAPSAANGWDTWIGDKANHTVSLLRAADRDSLDELSDDDLGILSKVWDEFGWMTKYQIRDYTHKNCPEWQDPDGSSVPIAYADVMRALGMETNAAEETEQRIRERSKLSRVFSG